MTPSPIQTGFASINDALIYYEIAGDGPPFVMIHAGVADSRQWNNEFAHFRADYQVLRYDMRGYGKSEPVEGEFRHLQDLTALLDYVRMDEPLILMGCSMGGSMAMDFALAYPARTRALIMVGSGPSGLQLDVPKHPKEDEAEKAYIAGDLDLVAEIETRIWFDGMGRRPSQVDQSMRKLAYEMNRTGLAYDARQLGKRLPDFSIPAAERLAELKVPVLVIVGSNDIPYIQAAATYIVQNASQARMVVISDAGHLPNMDHPDQFREIVTEFLDDVAS